jgi:hypothetical protein
MNQNTKVYHQPGREIPVLGEWDVVVFGGEVEPAFEILRGLLLAK